MVFLMKFWSGWSGVQKSLLLLFLLYVTFLLFQRSKNRKINRLLQNKFIDTVEIYGEIVRFLVSQTNLSERSASWIAAMAVHETGRFTSAIFWENRNLFGMKQATVRQNLAVGTSRGHAVYRLYSDSVEDFVLYLQHFKNNPNDQPTLHHFIRRLKADGYFEDTIKNYLRGVVAALDVHYAALHRSQMSSIPALRPFIKGWSTPVVFKFSKLNVF